MYSYAKSQSVLLVSPSYEQAVSSKQIRTSKTVLNRTTINLLLTEGTSPPVPAPARHLSESAYSILQNKRFVQIKIIHNFLKRPPMTFSHKHPERNLKGQKFHTPNNKTVELLFVTSILFYPVCWFKNGIFQWFALVL